MTAKWRFSLTAVCLIVVTISVCNAKSSRHRKRHDAIDIDEESMKQGNKDINNL